jgi:uncharacterized protein (DUF4213/DUF364 family)
MMKDPLSHFSEVFPFDIKTIDKFITADLFTAVLLRDGSLGVCANPEGKIPIDISKPGFPDLQTYPDRILYNAFLNARLNNMATLSGHADIMEVVDFSPYSHIMMVGYFSHIVRKLDALKIPVIVFDKTERVNRQADLHKMDEELKIADCVILTASTIANNTFSGIINKTPDHCHIYLLGPSAILDHRMFEYRNIRMIFGTQFTGDNQKVMEIIAAGGCGRDFLPFAAKVVVSSE